MAKQSASNSNQYAVRLLILCAMFLVQVPLFSQKYFSGRFELGSVFGGSNYHGDVSHGSNLKYTHPAGGIFFKYNISSYFSYRLQASYLRASASDKGTEFEKVRNFSFRTDIWEVNNQFEFNFQRFGTNVNDNFWTPYFFTGLSLFSFDPHRLENDDIHLRSLKTENRKRTYSKIQPAIPIGFGVKTMLQPKKNKGVWIVGIEGCWRKTFTDYLDDVNKSYPDYKATVDLQGIGSAQYSHAQTLNGSNPYAAQTQRGDTHLKDWYYFVGFSVSYRFTPLICR